MKQKRKETPVRFLPGQAVKPNEIPTKTGETVSSVLFCAAVFGLALFGSWFLFLDVFALPVQSVWCIAVISVFWILLTLLYAFLKGKKSLWLIAPVVLVLLLAFLWRNQLQQGLYRYFNRLAAMLNATTYWTFESFPLKMASQTAAARQNTLTACFLFFWFAMLLGYVSVRRPRVIALMLCTAVFLWAPVGFRLPVLLPAFFSIVMAIFTLYIYRFGTQRQRLGPAPKKAKNRSRSRAILPRMQTFAVIPIVLAAAVWAMSLLPQQGYRRPQKMTSLRTTIVNLDWQQINWNAVFGIRFQGFGNGDLRNLGELNFSDQTVLKVNASEAETRYLRHFSGAVFNNRKWEPVSEASYQSASAAFPDLVPQRLSAMLYEFEGEKAFYWNGNWFDFLPLPYTIRVRNVSAPKDAVFLTGFLKSDASEIGAVFSGDAQVKLPGGTDAYSFETYPVPVNSICSLSLTGESVGTVPEYYKSLDQSVLDMTGLSVNAKNREGLSFGDFRRELSAYNQYIYDTYTALPEDTRVAAEALRKEHEIVPAWDDWSVDIGRTIDNLRTLIQSRCRYTLSPDKIPSDVDFATYFLDKSKEGYCVHFATTATILLRSMGIPARYAEGFVLVPSDFRNSRDAEGFVSITEERAHAWVEVYDPIQLEWIPIEVTPGFSEEIGQVDRTQLPQITTSSETPETSSSSKPAVSSSRPAVSSSRPAVSSSASSSSSVSSQGTTVRPGGFGDAKEWIIYMLVPAGVVLLALLTLALRRLAIARRHKKIMQPNTNAAVLYGCRYLISMLHAAGCPAPQNNDTPASFSQKVFATLSWVPRKHLLSVLESGQKARFGQQPCSEEERTQMVSLNTELAEQIPNQQFAIRKVFFRWRFPRFPR